jgi:hypothetical protein
MVQIFLDMKNKEILIYFELYLNDGSFIAIFDFADISSVSLFQFEKNIHSFFHSFKNMASAANSRRHNSRYLVI